MIVMLRPHPTPVVRGLHDWLSRPVGVAVAQDGSLFVTEDGNCTIWGVSHQKVASSN
jgi:glucose/arabinose dehydrogenase